MQAGPSTDLGITGLNTEQSSNNLSSGNLQRVLLHEAQDWIIWKLPVPHCSVFEFAVGRTWCQLILTSQTPGPLLSML